MADSIRETVILGLKTALEGITGIAGLSVVRNEPDPFDQLPALNILDGASSQRVVDRSTTATIYSLDLSLEGYVAAAIPSETGPALSALAEAARAAAIGAETTVAEIDQVLDGDLSTDLADDEGSKPYGFFSLALEVRFGTVPGDPFTKA